MSIIKAFIFKDVQQQQQQQKIHLKVYHSHPKILTITAKNHLLKIRVIGARPAISTDFLPIGRDIEIPQTHSFIERKQYHNWKSSIKHGSSYYHPKPAND